MKGTVGIITYHGAYNYGSFLQAYALQQTILERYALDCRVINYRKQQQKEFYAIKKKNNSIKNILKNIVSYPYWKKLEKRNYLFELMINNELRITKEYGNKEELEDDLSKYTCIISGSDQIWNTGILDFDDIYLLNLNDSFIKVAYAASMGSFPKLNKNRMDLFRKCLKTYRKVSVREQTAQELLSPLCERKIEICADPTLLINCSIYDLLIKTEYLNERLPKENTDYLFFYSICYNQEMIDRVIAFSRKIDLPVYMVFTGSIQILKAKSKGVNVIMDASVSDFLYLIKHAKYVCSSSFHGTVFSLIYKKQFFVINEYKDGHYLVDARMKQLLEEVSLEKQMINDSFLSAIDKIDYKKVQLSIDKYIKKSFEFLDECMELF